MKRSLRTPVALATTALLSLISVFPAAATTVEEIQFSFNCDELAPYQDYNVPIAPGGSVTVNLVNCDDTYISDVTNGDAVPGNGDVSTTGGVVTNNDATFVVPSDNQDITFDAAATILFYGASGDTESEFIALVAIETNSLADPSGTQLLQSTAVIPLSPDTFSITDGVTDDEGDILLDGNVTCDLEPGDHVYAVQRFHVSDAGTYTFRLLGTDPISHSLDFNQVATPLEDPMVALFEGEFDPQNPGSNVSGCNDDLNDYEDLNGVDWTDTDTSWATTEDGDVIEDRFAYFVADLEPGDYSFVFTTYGAFTAEEWSSGDDWVAQDMTIDYDVWGPPAGLTEVDEFALAATGVDPAFGFWTGLALAGTGVAITVARRRANRA